MIKAIIKLFRMLIGFLFCAVSAVMAINSNLGVSPWDALHQGLSIKSGLTMGQSSILVSFLLILFTRLWGFKIGLGTISNMLVVGFLIDVIYFCQIIPRSSGLFMSMTFLLGSIMANALGCYFYISCELGAGPRDGFMIVISSILSFPISIVRAIIELAVATIGYLLGGLIGTGTVVIAVLLGVFLQIIFRLFNFDVKKASHKSLNDSL
ncbi:hypothetical protein IDE33_002803, partial [Enterococcus faecalis]|nr:hypothetical protein [Enterococcus faecalis]